MCDTMLILIALPCDRPIRVLFEWHFSMMSDKISLTGIKPTGSPHIGNWVGMLRPALELTKRYSAFCFIADYHALTTVRHAQQLRQLTDEVTAAWLAFGLDPERVVLYRQSDLPEVFELTWVLSCVSPKGLMNRAHAYKAAVDRNRQEDVHDVDAGINMGLYSYPVLMAADILLFRADYVPVGKDQIQHVEMARDIAERFNAAFGPVLKLPEALVDEDEQVAALPGIDGRKMSKSYGNTIPLFCSSSELRRLVLRIKTDSSRPEDPKDPEASVLFQILQHFAPAEGTERVRKALEAGGLAWSELKQELFETLDAFLAEPREHYQALMADRAQLDKILAAGAEKARPLACSLLEDVRAAIGVAR
jgi:tryptophanyl-tRNA synthetase